MSRWASFWLCAALGLGLLGLGWVIPVHLRAVDSVVLQRAGQNGPSLIERGQEDVLLGKLGPARMLLEAARKVGVPGHEKLGLAVGNLAVQNPAFLAWGGPVPSFAKIAAIDSNAATTNSEPLTDLTVRLDNREKLLLFLSRSENPAVLQLLNSRQLTNTVVFSPSSSPAGQAFDTAVLVTGLLLAEGPMNPGLSNSVLNVAFDANHQGQVERLEQLLLDFMSLGQRCDWTQTGELVSHVQDAETLRLLTMLARRSDAALPVLFSAVVMSGRPAEVAHYLMKFSQNGLEDLTHSMRYGAGALRELLHREQRWHDPAFGGRLVAAAPLNVFVVMALKAPRATLTLKWLLFLAAGFLFAAAVHYALPAVSLLERPLQVRGFHLVREGLFALGFLLVVLLLSEPFLSQENQRLDFPFKLHLPAGVGVLTTGKTATVSSPMHQMSLLTLLLFFVLQALIYTACVFKLAEIRRQNVPPRMKLKLLENEDHLFDAGLYLGFVGTIISLILVSLGIIQPSLMAAYSSTSFGIIFVSVFKIFNLRPVRRRLLLQAETGNQDTAAAGPAPSYATGS
jgi:hypothetical protein